MGDTSGAMKQGRRWLGLLLCLVLALGVSSIAPRFVHSLPGQASERELPYTLLAAVQTPGGYASPDTRLWLITQPEQIDQVRFFALPEVIAQLEAVDYRRDAVIVLLVSANRALTVERITSADGVLTLYGNDVTSPALAATSSAYHLFQIQRLPATPPLRKLVVHSTQPMLSPLSPILP